MRCDDPGPSFPRVDRPAPPNRPTHVRRVPRFAGGPLPPAVPRLILDAAPSKSMVRRVRSVIQDQPLQLGPIEVYPAPALVAIRTNHPIFSDIFERPATAQPLNRNPCRPQNLPRFHPRWAIWRLGRHQRGAISGAALGPPSRALLRPSRAMILSGNHRRSIRLTLLLTGNPRTSDH